MQRGSRLIDDIGNCHPEFGSCAFWWLGQHSFIVKFGEVVVYFDPYLTANPRRKSPPLLSPPEVTNADLILGSHDHADHIDHPSLPGMLAASPGATLVVPRLCREKLVAELGVGEERVVGINAGEDFSVKGVRIHALPAAHEFLDRDRETGAYPYLGFVVEGNGVCVYHAGDSCIYQELRPLLSEFSVDLAFLPINGRDAERLARNCIGNMTYQEAADLAGDLCPRLTIPAHFDMFAGNLEDPEAFRAYMQVKYPDLDTLVPEYGEAVYLAPR